MNNPPCIRGLQCFKKGCPQRSWDEKDGIGCPAWIELEMKTKGGTDTIKIKECMDMYMVRLMFHNNCLLEGNQQATESFRNGMVYKNESGEIVPKPNDVELALLMHIRDTQKRLQKVYKDNDLISE